VPVNGGTASRGVVSRAIADGCDRAREYHEGMKRLFVFSCLVAWCGATAIVACGGSDANVDGGGGDATTSDASDATTTDASPTDAVANDAPSADAAPPDDAGCANLDDGGCLACCAQEYPDATVGLFVVAGECACGKNGQCQTECANSLCTAKKPDKACEVCLTTSDAGGDAGTCAHQAVESCSNDPSCQAAAQCIEACKN